VTRLASGLTGAEMAGLCGCVECLRFTAFVFNTVARGALCLRIGAVQVVKYSCCPAPPKNVLCPIDGDSISDLAKLRAPMLETVA
jgi:hypothetical protein